MTLEIKERPRSVLIAWMTVALATLIAAGAIVVDALPLGSPVDPAASAVALGWLVYAVVGAVIWSRRPGDRIGALLLAMGLAAEPLAFADQLLGVMEGRGTAGALAARDPFATWVIPLLLNLWVVSFTLLGVLMLVFPTGRALSPRWRPAIWIAFAMIPFGLVTAGDPTGAAAPPFPLLDAIFGTELGRRLREEGQGIFGMFQLALFVVGAVSLVLRYRRASGVERQQLKWLAYAAVLFAAVSVGTAIVFFSPLRALDPDAPIPPAVFGGVPFILALVAIPVSVGIAILRYRLYDIDVLINRTLVYGALSTVLAATYVATVLVLSALLRPIAGSSELAVAGSTLAVVALFGPLRARIQRAVDRRFYRSRYDAERTVDAFAARLREELDLAALRSALLATVRDTIRPAHASLWLREGRR